MAVAREDIETYKILMRGGQPRKALGHLKALLGQYGADKGLLAVSAPLAMQLGENETAIKSYTSLLSFPDIKAEDFFNIGYALKSLGEFQAALKAYNQALGAGLSKPEEAYLNIGVIYADELQDLSAAEQAFQKAISLNPSILGPYINLGNLYEETGDFNKAAALYDAASQNVENAFEAIARLSNAHEYESVDDPLLATLTHALKAGAVTDFDKECLHFALGTALDTLGEYERAWSHFERANAHGEKYGRAYNTAQTQTFVDNVIAHYDSQLLEAASTPEKTHPAPIFICGMFRSGSTLTEQILSAHPDFTPLGECGFIPKTAQAVPEFYPQQSVQLSPEEYRELRGEYYQQNAVKAVTTPYFTDKRPDNLLYMGFIKQIFPEAKFIFTERDARDNYLSIFFTQFGDGQAYARKFTTIADYHSQQNRLMEHWNSLFGTDILRVNYDALISDPETHVRNLLSAIGAPWNENCLAFHTQTNRVKTASYKQVRRPFYKGSSGRWKNYHPWMPEVNAE